MIDRLSTAEYYKYNIHRLRGHADPLAMLGKFRAEFFRQGRKYHEVDFENLVTNQGKNYILDAGFNNGTRYSSWYLGLIDNNGFTTVASTDIPTSHTGWLEWTSYSEATRQAWNKTSATSQTVSSTDVAIFTMSANGTLAGGFIIADPAKGGTTTILWSAGTFTAVPVQTADQMRLTYQTSIP